MYIFQIFKMLLMVVTWTNIEVDVPVYSSIDEYINIPKAVLTEKGNVFNDPEMHYVYDGVDNNFYSDLDTNYVGRVRYMIKAVFPTYGVESKQEIIFNIVDITKPTIISVPKFVIQVGQKIPDVLIGLDYSDNHYLKSELTVNVLGLDTVNNKKVGKYYFDYQVIDPSNNIGGATSYIEVIDTVPPEIIKLRETKIELGETFDVYAFYKFSDNHDQYVNVSVNTSNVNFNKIGTYGFIITAKDSSNNQKVLMDNLEIVYTGKPELDLYSNLLSIEVGTTNYEIELIQNIKNVFDKVDELTISDVIISHLININKLGKYGVEYKVINSHNQETIKLIDVNVLDTTKPIINLINELIIPYGINSFIHQNYFEIYDNYDEYADLTINFTQKIDFKSVGDYPIKVEVTDKSKNKSIFEGVISVVDLEPPVFIMEDDQIEINVFSNYNFENYIIKDNYDSSPSLTPKKMYFNQVGTFEILLTASDSSGNKTNKIVLVTVVDNESPTIILSTNEIKLSIGAEKINPKDYIVNAFDNYDELTIEDILVIDNINYHELGKYELIYHLTDSSGNEEYKIIEVTIDDTSKPIINTKNEIINYKSDFDVWDGVEIIDNDDNLTLNAYPSYIDTSKIGSYTITYVIIDSRGNITKTTRQIEVADEKQNSKIALYVGINFAVTALLTSGTYLFFKKKKRKWLLFWHLEWN